MKLHSPRPWKDSAKRFVLPLGIYATLLGAVAPSLSAANVSWIATGTNSWNTGSNWNTSNVPGVGDIAFITTSTGGATVNYASPMAAASVGGLSIGATSGQNILNVSAGGFDVTGTTAVTQRGLFRVQNGGVATSGVVAITGASSASALVQVDDGGSLSASSITLNTNINSRLTNSGVLSVSGLTTVNSGRITLQSGTSSFNGITFTNSADGSSLTVSGGINSLGAVTINRDGNPGVTSGIIVSGGTNTATSVVLGAGNSWGNMNMSGGNFTITGTSGGFIVGQQSTAARGGNLSVTGGNLSYAGTDGLILSNAVNNVGQAAFSGGTSTFERITLIGSTVTSGTGSASLAISGNGTVYVGAGGIVSNAGLNGNSATSTITLSGGTLGATANWTSSANMTLSGSSRIKTSDSLGVVHNISLSGSLTGTGELIKTGSGTLSLSGSNSYTGRTTVSEGTLLIASNAAVSGSSAIDLTNGGSLDVSNVAGFTLTSGQALEGAGTVSGAITIGSGATLTPGNGIGSILFSDNVTLALGSVSTFEINGFTSGLYDLAQGNAGISFDGTLNLAFQTEFNLIGTAQIFDFDSYSGSFMPENFHVTGLASGFSATFDAANGTVTVVPEPSAVGLLAIGVGALVWRSAYRRRKTN